MPSFHDAYGIWSPEVTAMEIVNTRHKHSLMVIPLAGGGCASDDHMISRPHVMLDGDVVFSPKKL